MSVVSGCTISDGQAYCAIDWYLTDVAMQDFLGDFNINLFSRIFACALAVISVVKVVEAGCRLYKATKIDSVTDSNKNSSGSACWNLSIIALAGVSLILLALTKNNPSWIVDDWNSTVKWCVKTNS